MLNLPGPEKLTEGQVSTPNAKSKCSQRKTEHDEALSRLLMGDGIADVFRLLRSPEVFDVAALVPPKSIMAGVVNAIERETDCPPALAVTSTCAVLSAALCATGTTYSYFDDMRRIHPALWLVMFAESGAGKTFVRDIVAEGMQIALPCIATPGSGPAFIDAIAAVNGRGYWDKDEYGQTLKQIAKDSTMVALKDALLQCYDHRTLSNRTRSNGLVEVEKPVLVIFGSTPYDSLKYCLDLEMLMDGFAARHLWAAVERRPLTMFRYNTGRVLACIERHPAIGMLRRTLSEQRHFTINEAASTELSRCFTETASLLGDSLSRGFVRRITWAAGHYAVIYHLLTQREPNDRIGVASVRWAWRMVKYHLYSAKLTFALTNPSATKKLATMMNWVDSKRSEGISDQVLVRKLMQRFSHDISCKDEALGILAAVGGEL